jgi:hypothetical protein
MEVSIVPKEYVEGCWDQIEGYLEGAAKYTFGRYTVDDIKDCVTDYDYQLWIAFENEKIYGAVVTEFVHYPQCKMLSMQFCGGVELKKWKAPMLDILQRWAKDNGCKAIESPGRPGWAKIFRDDGYEAKFITYELPVG